MSVRTKVATIAMCLMLVVSIVTLVPRTASADTRVDMNLVCQQNMHSDSWAAKLINSHSAYGWKCWNRAYPEQYWLGPFFDADVNYYCWAVEGTSSYNTNTSDPYSWWCR